MIKVRIIFQLMGWPQEALMNTLKNLMNVLKKSWKIEKEEYSEPEKVENSQMYSAFVEFIADIDDIYSLFSFVITYAPSVIEVLEPAEVVVPINKLQDILADLTGKLQDLDKEVKFLSAQNINLKKKLGINTKEESGPKKVELKFQNPKK